MPLDMETIADPGFILLTWAAGLALAAGFVSYARLVGRGFTWLIASTAGVLGLAGWAVEGAMWSRFAVIAVIATLLAARHQAFAGVMMVLAGVAYVVDAAPLGGWLLTSTATLALGGVTAEMMLAHWYLVDPRLPRWALRTLAVGGIVGLLADGAALAVVGEMAWSGPVAAFVSLLAISVLLMVGVIGALRHPAYSGVMAATGLSYLAVLTTLGAVFLGRALLAGIGPFAS